MESPFSKPISRRQALTAFGAAAGALTLPGFLAACSSGSSSKAASTSASGAASSVSSSSGAPAGSVQDILKYIGPIDPKFAGAGETWNVGLSLPFSGSGAFFGRLWQTGSTLAVKHIKALGGPTIAFDAEDHGGDPQKGVASVVKFSGQGIGAMLTSYAADLGAELPGIAQYKILSFDGGAGTAGVFNGKPYFYGTRSQYPVDAFGGAAAYVHQKMPNVKKLALVLGQGPTFDATYAALEKSLDGYGITLVKPAQPSLGTTDFSNIITQLRSERPDMVWTADSTNDMGYFMKQYSAAGIGAPVLGFEYTASAASIAGKGYNGMLFSQDYFNPTNPWSEIFITEYKAANNGAIPDYYPATFYEDTFLLWALYQRVKKAGGDVNSGPDLLAAFQSNPTFPSLFGGDATTAGVLKVDTTSHTVVDRPMAITEQISPGKIVTHATFSSGSREITLT